MTDYVGVGQVGGECKEYYNTGSYGSPTWTENQNVQDLDIDDSRSKVEVPVRSHFPFVGHLPGKRIVIVSWNSVRSKGTTDAVLAAMITAYENGTVVEFALSDIAIATTGAKYKRIQCIIYKKHEGEEIDGAVMIDFEAAFALNCGGNLPSRVTA